MIYEELIDEASKELNIDKEVVNLAYKSYWEFIRDTIQKLPLKEDITEEEFNKLRLHFNIPSLGKLVCPYDKYAKVKKKFNYIKKLKGRC